MLNLNFALPIVELYLDEVLEVFLVVGFKFLVYKIAVEYIDSSGNFGFYEIFCSTNFFIELHLGDVLEVLLVVRSKYLFTKLVDNDHR